MLEPESLKAIQDDSSLTTEELVAYYLERIEEFKHLNAFLEVFPQTALTKAREIDEKIKAGTAGKLAGMVIGIKDNICYKDHKVSGASKILKGFVSVYHSTAVERLLEQDAVIIGRLNCDEFGMGSSNENSAFATVHNPINIKMVAGGSSGGSAAAVRAGLCLAALGSDTGGSIRQPAAYCGVIGLKPTYGRISRHGLLAYGSSFDQIGPITKNTADAKLLVEVMQGSDDYDATARKSEMRASTKKTFNIAVPVIDSAGLDSEVHAALDQACDQLQKAGHSITKVTLDLIDKWVPTYYVLSTAEASSNLSRYNGVNFGYRSGAAADLESTYKLSRTEGFGDEVKKRILLGTYVLSEGHFDAYYKQAQQVRRLIKKEVDDVLQETDCILLPTSPTTAYEIGASKDPIKTYLEDIYTVMANLCGLPAVSVPVGDHSNGLPIGLQCVGAEDDELNILAIADSILAGVH